MEEDQFLVDKKKIKKNKYLKKQKNYIKLGNVLL